MSVQLDLSQTQRFIETIYPTTTAGNLSIDIPHPDPKIYGMVGKQFRRDNLPELLKYVEKLDQRGGPSIYLRTTTVCQVDSGRGMSRDSVEFPGFWADGDFGDAGHQHNPGPRAEGGHGCGTPLPPDETAMWNVIQAAKLPITTMVHSGGGLYPWWLLDTTERITPSNYEYLARLSKRWQNVIYKIARDMGYCYGPVGDFARVLRLAGTVNRKANTLPRPVQIVVENGPRHTLKQLEAAIEWGEYQFRPDPVPYTSTVTKGDKFFTNEYSPVAHGTGSPFDDFETRTDWGYIIGSESDLPLERQWTLLDYPGVGQQWTRPGKSDGISATTGRDPDRDRMYNFSKNAMLPDDVPMTKPYVYAQLHHGGDMKAAARALHQQGYGAREWGQPVSTNEWEAASADDPRFKPTRVSQEHLTAPLWCLPPILQDFVLNVAQHTQTAPEMALLACLASLSFATGGNVMVDINGHTEPLTLWVEVTALPSERKSSAIGEAARKPLEMAIHQYWADNALRQQKLNSEIKASTKKVGKIEAKLAADENPEETSKELEAELIRTGELRSKVIHKPVWSISDATVEGLEAAMSESSGVIASFADEAALLSTIAGRYSKNGGVNLGSMNDAWSSVPIYVRRVSEIREVPKPHLVLCQFLQPERFMELMGALRQQQDGFLSRWLYANPAPYGPRASQSAQIDLGLQDQWVKTLHSLLVRFWGQRQRSQLCLDQDAWMGYHQIFAEIDADRVAHQHSNGALSQWLGKAANAHVVRIAALLQLSFSPDSWTITGQAMQAAVTLYKWLRAEAVNAMELTSGDFLQPEVETAVLAWIGRQRKQNLDKGMPALGFITARDLKRGPQRFRAVATEEIEAALMHLETQNWLLRTDPAGRTDAQTKWAVRTDFEKVWEG